jgi:hypothetical protein
LRRQEILALGVAAQPQERSRFVIEDHDPSGRETSAGRDEAIDHTLHESFGPRRTKASGARQRVGSVGSQYTNWSEPIVARSPNESLSTSKSNVRCSKWRLPSGTSSTTGKCTGTGARR